MNPSEDDHRPRRLPSELWDAILGFVSDLETLKAYSLQSKSSCALARRHLFSQISIRNTITRLQEFSDFLTSSPHISMHIQSLKLNNPSQDFDPSVIEPDILFAVLSVLPALHCLELTELSLRARQIVPFERPAIEELKHLDIKFRGPFVREEINGGCPIPMLNRFFSLFGRIEKLSIQTTKFRASLRNSSGLCQCVQEAPSLANGQLSENYIAAVLKAHSFKSLNIQALALLTGRGLYIPLYEELLCHTVFHPLSLNSIQLQAGSLEVDPFYQNILRRAGGRLQCVQVDSFIDERRDPLDQGEHWTINLIESVC